MKTMSTNMNTRAEFLRGFESTTGLNPMLAREQWDAFSRMLNDDEIDRIEAGGFAEGATEGAKFNGLYK